MSVTTFLLLKLARPRVFIHFPSFTFFLPGSQPHARILVHHPGSLHRNMLCLRGCGRLHALLCEVVPTMSPASFEHMFTFIYLAYSMMALLYGTVPCLGDFGRYRMAVWDQCNLDWGQPPLALESMRQGSYQRPSVPSSPCNSCRAKRHPAATYLQQEPGYRGAALNKSAPDSVLTLSDPSLTDIGTTSIALPWTPCFTTNSTCPSSSFCRQRGRLTSSSFSSFSSSFYSSCFSSSSLSRLRLAFYFFHIMLGDQKGKDQMLCGEVRWDVL